MSQTQQLNQDSDLTYENELGSLDLNDSNSINISDSLISGLYETCRVVTIAITAIVLMLSYYGWFLVGLVPSVYISAYILIAISVKSVVLLFIMTPLVWLLGLILIGAVVEYLDYRF